MDRVAPFFDSRCRTS